MKPFDRGTSYVVPATDLLGVDNLFKSMDDLGYKTIGDAVITRKNGVFFGEALAASAAAAV